MKQIVHGLREFLSLRMPAPFDHDTGYQSKIVKPHFELTPQMRPFIEQLRESHEPEKKILAQLAESSDINRQETQWQSSLMIDTEYQARVTNGRVTKIEIEKSTVKLIVFTVLIVVIVLFFHDRETLSAIAKYLFTA